MRQKNKIQGRLGQNVKQARRRRAFQPSLVEDRSERCVWHEDTSSSFSGDNWARVFMSGARKAAGIMKEIYSNEVGCELRCHLAQKGLGLQFHYGMRAMRHQHAVWHPNVGFLFKTALCVPVNRAFQWEKPEQLEWNGCLREAIGSSSWCFID